MIDDTNSHEEDSHKEIALKVRQNLESSQNISFLNEYCQKNQRPLPEWTPISTPASHLTGYVHGMQVMVDGQRFECRGATNRQEAKRACANAAVEYFEKQKIPFFTKRDHNYVSLLHQLCQAAVIDLPTYSFNTINGDNNFTCICFVRGGEYQSKFSYPKKHSAKEDSCRVAFEALCVETEITNKIFITKPSFVTQVTRLDAGVKNHVGDTGPAERSLSPKRKTIEDEKPVSYQDLLWEYYESRPELGKPFYNYRPVKNEDGSMSYRAQLLMGTFRAVGETFPSQTDAANDAAKMVFMKAHPKAEEVVERMAKHVKKMDAKQKVREDDSVYYSDDEKMFPSYEQMLREMLIQQGSMPPEFTYNTGEKGGIVCSGTIMVPALGKMQTMVSLRDHSCRATAREDVSHDLYVLLRNYPVTESTE